VDGAGCPALVALVAADVEAHRIKGHSAVRPEKGGMLAALRRFPKPPAASSRESGGLPRRWSPCGRMKAHLFLKTAGGVQAFRCIAGGPKPGQQAGCLYTQRPQRRSRPRPGMPRPRPARLSRARPSMFPGIVRPDHQRDKRPAADLLQCACRNRPRSAGSEAWPVSAEPVCAKIRDSSTLRLLV